MSVSVIRALNHVGRPETRMETAGHVAKQSKLLIGVTVIDIGLAVACGLGVITLGITTPWALVGLFAVGGVIGCAGLIYRYYKQRKALTDYANAWQPRQPFIPAQFVVIPRNPNPPHQPPAVAQPAHDPVIHQIVMKPNKSETIANTSTENSDIDNTSTENSDEDLCQICMDNKRGTTGFVPTCNNSQKVHEVCRECFENLEKCPICRGPLPEVLMLLA